MEIKEILGKVLDVASPLVEAFVPGSGLAIQGVKAIAKAFGLKENDVTPERLSQLAAEDKDFALKMRQAEMDYQLKLNEQELQKTQQLLADVQNARNMNVETTKATGKRDLNLYLLAWVIVLGFMALVALLIFKELPKNSNNVIFMLFGALPSGSWSSIRW